MRVATGVWTNSGTALRFGVAVVFALAPPTLLLAQAIPADQQPAGQAAPATQQPDAKQATLRAAYDAAFQATMDKPSDPAALLKFAELAVEFGDIEGAISALERLLLIDGDQPEVKLELGVLYYRLGSNEMARSYLEAARKSDSATDDIRKRATTFLKEGVKP